jgi:glucose-6-phosphate 1-dehydrogenase
MSAYERLLLDCLLGDSTLFTRRDEVEEAWDLVEPLLRWWEQSAQSDPVPLYPAGTWGPEAARVLIARNNRRWRQL